MTNAMSPAERLIVALDVPSASEALRLAEILKGRVGMLKIGLELFCAEGPAFVKSVQRYAPVFLDLKLHDIPTTVKRALETLLPLEPRLINIHAQGGPSMIQAAAEAVKAHRSRGGQTELLAVTVLTSLDREALAAYGLAMEPGELALNLATLARHYGADGVVCSAQEVARLRQACGSGFSYLTPGIRPRGVDTQDQARVVTPDQAIRNGSTWLVVGRPITRAADPGEAADRILADMALA
jgi:orotidine-5'-phosphate decarboxylase